MSSHDCVMAGSLAWVPVPPEWVQALISASGSLPCTWELGFWKCLCKQYSSQNWRHTRHSLCLQTGWAPCGTSFFIQSGKRWEIPQVYTGISKLFFSPFLSFLSFTTGDSAQFQGSYGKFLRCDKDSLGFCPIDFYGTVDGCKIRVGTVQPSAWQSGLCRIAGGLGAGAGWSREGTCCDLVPREEGWP